MNDRVTLEYLEQLDAAIAHGEQHVDELVVQLAYARQDVAVLRARQANAAAAYNRQAARPLTPPTLVDDVGFPMAPPTLVVDDRL